VSADHDDPHDVPIDEELDLHAFAPRDMQAVVVSYLEAAHEKGLREVRIVHGRGRGVQRALTHRTLEAHPLVEAFDDDPRSHLGAVRVRLVP
jgi:DNA-nicking Smr family endonuclease